MRRLGAAVDPDFTVDRAASQAVDVMIGDAVIAPLPGSAAIGARVHGTEERAREQGATGRLENNRADVLAFERAPDLAPFSVVALEQNQAVLGRHPELVRSFAR